jgi:hypothetical protein
MDMVAQGYLYVAGYPDLGFELPLPDIEKLGPENCLLKGLTRNLKRLWLKNKGIKHPKLFMYHRKKYLAVTMEQYREAPLLWTEIIKRFVALHGEAFRDEKDEHIVFIDDKMSQDEVSQFQEILEGHETTEVEVDCISPKI